ncbi:MAG: NUDIX hydrolase [Candidatus Gracilibacteria bacterium]|nr:NUDIX hydrolase [Candidatus Gracilibacteria bacterium]MDD3120453.1 NUDIX hydrolase [Candidatus Gracilibacteria bacterium]MDD4530487.1 NUDIX hydrolase [Candidatus Gracilibacteria bacterium]
MEQIKVACSCVIRKENKFLLVKETKKLWEGQFGMPGGTLELYESILDCAKREVKEETGFDVELIKFIKIINFPKSKNLNTTTIFLFEGEVVGGKITESEEHPDVNYFSLEEIKSMNERGIFRQPRVIEIFENIDSSPRSPVDLIKVIKF